MAPLGLEGADGRCEGRLPGQERLGRGIQRRRTVRQTPRRGRGPRGEGWGEDTMGRGVVFWWVTKMKVRGG